MLRRCGCPRAYRAAIVLVLASRLDKVLYLCLKFRVISQTAIAIVADRISPYPYAPLHHGTICPHL